MCQFCFFGPAGESVEDLPAELEGFANLLQSIVQAARGSSSTAVADVLGAVVAYAASEPVKGAYAAYRRRAHGQSCLCLP